MVRARTRCQSARTSLDAASARTAVDADQARKARRRGVAFPRESYGWECLCLYDGELVYGRRFVMKEGAVAEAAAQRQRLIAEGWTLPLTSRPADAVEESSCVRLQ